MPEGEWYFADGNTYRRLGIIDESAIMPPNPISGYDTTPSYLKMMMNDPIRGTLTAIPDMMSDLLCQELADRPTGKEIHFTYRKPSLYAVRYKYVWQYRLERKGNRSNRRGSKKHLRHVPIAMREVVLHNAIITGGYQSMSDSAEPVPVTVSFECEGISQ